MNQDIGNLYSSKDTKTKLSITYNKIRSQTKLLAERLTLEGQCVQISQRCWNIDQQNLLTEKNMETSEAKTFLDDVIKGLSLAQKQLSPKYFYDEFGAKIFERICSTPEYYPCLLYTSPSPRD